MRRGFQGNTEGPELTGFVGGLDVVGKGPEKGADTEPIQGPHLAMQHWTGHSQDAGRLM